MRDNLMCYLDFVGLFRITLTGLVAKTSGELTIFDQSFCLRMNRLHGFCQKFWRHMVLDLSTHQTHRTCA